MRRPRKAAVGVLSPRRAPKLGKIHRRACLRLIPFPGTGDVLLAPHHDKPSIGICHTKPPTTSVSEICSFPGLTGYYRRFIENFSKIAKAMTELLKKDTKFKWMEECEASFQELKKRLTTAPVLILPDIRKDFQVYCDASRLGLGGVLMQDRRIVSYAS